MAVIRPKFEAGELTDAAKATSIIRDIAADLVGLGAATTAPAAVASAAAVAAVTAVANAAGDVGSGALANDLKAKYNAAVTLINELQAKVNLLTTLINELRAGPPAGYVLKTSLG